MGRASEKQAPAYQLSVTKPLLTVPGWRTSFAVAQRWSLSPHPLFVRPFAVADARAGMGLRARRRTLCSAKRTIPEMKEATP